jgi:hypothetical protein
LSKLIYEESIFWGKSDEESNLDEENVVLGSNLCVLVNPYDIYEEDFYHDRCDVEEDLPTFQ